jgi:Ca2+-binding RTX toxin-like protein
MTVIITNRPNLGSGSIKFIEGIPFVGIGSAGFDSDDLLIIGDDLDNLDLIGSTGNDEIEGGGGNDILREGLGNGILKGGNGNDDLDGGPGTELLFGGNGDDILRAGGTTPQLRPVGDYDRLNGGAGKDIFGFYGIGHFEIADFSLGEDRLFFDSSVLGINEIGQLLLYITSLTDNSNSGFTVHFGSTASIELVGVNLNSITADMIIFSL